MMVVMGAETYHYYRLNARPFKQVDALQKAIHGIIEFACLYLVGFRKQGAIGLRIGLQAVG